MPPAEENRIDWLAQEIFKAYPYDCPGLKVYVLDCGCLYYQRVFRDGREDAKVGIYRDPAYVACEVCIERPNEWEHRVVDETVIYNTGAVIQERRF